MRTVSRNRNFFFSAIPGFRICEIDKARKIQGKIKSTVFGKLNQKWLFDFHKAHTKEGSVHMKKKEERKKKRKREASFGSKMVLGDPQNHGI